MRSEDQEIDKWQQLKGSTLPYSADFSLFAASHSLTFSTATAASSDTSIVSIGGEAASSDLWSAELTAVNEGCAMITVTATFTGSDVVRVRRFQVDVTDPECDSELSGNRY